jgi:hypothetical protein
MRRIVSIAFVSFMTACGDPLIGESYRGTPALTIGGVVMQASSRIPSNHGPLALSIFWIGATNGEPWPIEQEGLLDSGLAEYSMILFDPPPASASRFSALTGGGALAIGVIALYADKNENGVLELEGDLLLGASAQHLLVYAGADIPETSAASSLLGPIAAGYHIYGHDRPSVCRFIDAAHCAPEGALAPADARAVSLTLWMTPEEVVVPAPAMMQNGEITSVWSAF